MDQIPFAWLFKGNLFGSTFASYSVADPGEGPGPPPPILYFCLLLTFHFSEWIERVISFLVHTSPVTEEEMVCNATSQAEINKTFLEEVYIFLSNIKAWAGFDRRLNLVVSVSM